MGKTLTYKGLITERCYGENDEAVYLLPSEAPLADTLEDEIAGKTVTCRYWITADQCEKIEAIESFLKTLHGAADAEYGDRYSEITGYLWTDEELKIGGHDLLEELRSHVGKWLILEFDIHDGPPEPQGEKK